LRLYHFTNQKWGRIAIANKRLKIAQISNLNDPFELLATSLRDKKRRRAFIAWKEEMNRQFGVLCFSEGWESPLLWGHYADRHCGLCLGFDVKDDLLIKVKYQKARDDLRALERFDEEFMKEAIAKKYEEWAYEREQRVFCRLVSPDLIDGLYYREFDDALDLREIIVGPLCNSDRTDLEGIISYAGLPVGSIELQKARLAFKSYQVVPDKRGLQ
jgi:hypothetical protein